MRSGTFGVVNDDVARRFRLWPSERLLWHAMPVAGTPRPAVYGIVSAVSVATAVACLLFGLLLRAASLDGFGGLAATALYALVFLVGAQLLPRYALDPCEFALTSRRVLWRRGSTVRSIDRSGISFVRVQRHRSERGIGTVEIVRAVPFGPLLRQERLVLHDLRDPDAFLAELREVPFEPSDDPERPLVERLDADEKVLWGAGPEGAMLGWRELSTAALGVSVMAFALWYASVTFGALRSLEEAGLPVGSEVWWLFFAACSVTFALVAAVGGGLVWWGVVRARNEGRDTEYLVTDRRVLIRRGRTELSLDRTRIFDVAERRSALGLRHVFFILDGPEGRALGDSGALHGLLPSRDGVPPILYDLRDVGALRTLFGREERDSLA